FAAEDVVVHRKHGSVIGLERDDVESELRDAVFNDTVLELEELAGAVRGLPEPHDARLGKFRAQRLEIMEALARLSGRERECVGFQPGDDVGADLRIAFEAVRGQGEGKARDGGRAGQGSCAQKHLSTTQHGTLSVGLFDLRGWRSRFAGERPASRYRRLT